DGIRDRNVTGVQTCALPICVVHQVPACCPGVYGLGGLGAQGGEFFLCLGACSFVFVAFGLCVGAVGLGPGPVGLGGVQGLELFGDCSKVVLSGGGTGRCGGGQVLAGVDRALGVVGDACSFGCFDQFDRQALGGGTVVFESLGDPVGLGAQACDLLGPVVDAGRLCGQAASFLLGVGAALVQLSVIAKCFVVLQGLDLCGGVAQLGVVCVHLCAGPGAFLHGPVVCGGGLGDGVRVLDGSVLCGGDAGESVAGVGGEVVGVAFGEDTHRFVGLGGAVEAASDGGKVGEVTGRLVQEGVVDGAESAGEGVGDLLRVQVLGEQGAAQCQEQVEKLGVAIAEAEQAGVDGSAVVGGGVVVGLLPQRGLELAFGEGALVGGQQAEVHPHAQVGDEEGG